MDTLLCNDDGTIINFTVPSATDEVLAFHYGNFDDAYGDGTIGVAAANGRVYGNTVPATLPAKFGSIGTPSTASGQTTYTWTPPSTTLQANVLVVAGGGGGGGVIGGGGGAGGIVYKTDQTLNVASYTIKVGQGGTGGNGWNTSTQNGKPGKDSVFGTYTSAKGGGGGVHYGGNTTSTIKDGGSGGGGANGSATGGTSTQTDGYGNDGGDNGDSNRGAGGGGATEEGFPTEGVYGGAGGAGFLASAFGETYGEGSWFAGGGGGGVRSGAGRINGTGGIGGGGDGTITTIRAEDGKVHTGGGGGGGGYSGTSSAQIGGNGGSGIVLVRYIADNTIIVAKADVFNYVSSSEYTSASPTLYTNDTTGDWVTVYNVSNPTRDGGGNIQYTINNSIDLSGYSYTRVGYLLTHKFSGKSTIDWVFCTFDKWSSTITDLRVPDPNDAFTNQRNVANLNVYSSNQTAQPNRNNVSGRLEIWPYNYGTAVSGLSPAGSNTLYDYDDTSSGSGSYGSFQCHDVTNGVTCLAWNRHGHVTPDVGIGNNVSGNPFYDSSGHLDWTFAQSFNSDFSLRIMVM